MFKAAKMATTHLRQAIQGLTTVDLLEAKLARAKSLAAHRKAQQLEQSFLDPNPLFSLWIVSRVKDCSSSCALRCAASDFARASLASSRSNVERPWMAFLR